MKFPASFGGARDPSPGMAGAHVCNCILSYFRASISRNSPRSKLAWAEAVSAGSCSCCFARGEGHFFSLPLATLAAARLVQSSPRRQKDGEPVWSPRKLATGNQAAVRETLIKGNPGSG